MTTEVLNSIETHQVTEGLTVWRLGGASTALKTPKALVYLDLFLGPNPLTELHKATEDLIDPNTIRLVDAVVITHHDVDHCHRESLAPILAHTDALFIGPKSVMKLLREWGFDNHRLVELSSYQSIQIKDLLIWAVPCNDYFDADANSYVFESGGFAAFDGGDTLYYSEYVRVGKKFNIDLAMLNFAKNPPGEIYYMNHAHVARTAEELNTRILLPKHYDLWEEFLEDPQKLVPMLEPKGITVKILKQGERLSVTDTNRG
jgi:L-ascorbate 6-phosphate lactonase